MEPKPVYKTKGNKDWGIGSKKKRATNVLLFVGASRILSRMAASLGIFSPTSPGGTGSISGLINNIAEGALEVYLASKETSKPDEPGYYFAYYRGKRWEIVTYTGDVNTDIEVPGTSAPYNIRYFTRWVKVPIPYCLKEEDL